MNRFFSALVTLICLHQAGFSQTHGGFCGTSGYDNYYIKQRMLQNREDWAGKIMQRNGGPYYVPVNYWLVAKSDGSGRLPFKNVIDHLCAMNKIYENLDIVFYLNGASNVNNNYIYDDPSSTLGKAYINQIMLSNKNAINIFTASIANASDPNVLAFYTRDGDYVVTNKNYVNSDASTIAHEVGHYFSLAHTFYGWEGTIYKDLTENCIKATPTVVTGLGFPVDVEYVDRDRPGPNGKKHCEVAADGFCDTPADYNLGYGWTGGCNYDDCAKDPDNVKLDPMETNFMSYFLNCIAVFTTQQKEAIVKDYLSNNRNYLRRTQAYNPLPLITDPVIYIKPTTSNQPIGYDIVSFDWEDVPNAEYYIFEVAENTGFNINAKTYILNHSDTVLTTLKAKKTYFWRVTPYNKNSFCSVPKLASFTTPSWTVAADDLNTEHKSFISFAGKQGGQLFFNSETRSSYILQIVNVNGAVQHEIAIMANSGMNAIDLPMCAQGFYFYRVWDANDLKFTGKFLHP